MPKDINITNIYLMIISLSLASILPFEVFLLSYAVLGPLHYLTEISWLKDKGYFLPKKEDKWIIFLLSITVLLGSLTFLHLTQLKIFEKYYALGIYFAFLIPLILIMTTNWEKRIYCLLILIMLSFTLLIPVIALLFLVYLPTLIHVYIFTGFFILFGSIKSQSKTGYYSFIVFLMCPIICFLLPSDISILAGKWAQNSYNGTFSLLSGKLLENLFQISYIDNYQIYHNSFAIKIGRFIAFAYTYHYLNWFSKTKIIKWNDISKQRLLVILAIWLLCIGTYFYDYVLGFQLLFVLSFTHVVLEFPLNHVSIIGIIKSVKVNK